MIRVRRGKGGFSLVMTIFIGIILTGAALAMMFRSSNEVQLASSQSTSVIAMNAAESVGAIALQELLGKGKEATIPPNTTSAGFLNYLCKSYTKPGSSTTTPIWVLVKQSTAGKYTVVGQDTIDPIALLPGKNLAQDTGVLKKNDTTLGGNLGLDGLSNYNCPTADPIRREDATREYPNGKITKVSFLPGANGVDRGLTWTNEQVDPLSGDIFLIRNRALGNAGDNNVQGQVKLKNFRLNVVEAIADATNQPTNAFRLVYTFDIEAQGEVLSPSGNEIGRQIIQAPNVLVIKVSQQPAPGPTTTTRNSSLSQYTFFMDDQTNHCFGGNQIIRGRAHVNRNPGFCPGSGETRIKFLGEFTSASCGYVNSTNCPNGKYNTSRGTLVTDGADFQGGSKFYEEQVGFIEKPSIGNYQLKAALQGQTDPSSDPSNDVLKNSEIRSSLGLNASTETEPPDGVYWTNPAIAGSNLTTYDSWLTQAKNNTSSSLLPGIYIKGNVDYVNMYAAKSSGLASSPDVQVVEVQQNAEGTTRRTKFTMNKATDTTVVQVATLDARGNVGPYSLPISYGKASNGVIFIDGKVGDNTQSCTSRINCRGLMSIPEDSSSSMNLSGGVTDTPAIQKDWGVTLAVNGDIALQDNLDYQVDPRGADREYGTGDDPSVSEAQNTLGIVAFDTKQVKNANGSITSSSINPTQINVPDGKPGGTIYWGKGIADNVRLGKSPDNDRKADVLDLQAILYGFSQTLNRNNGRLAEYVQILGGEIRTAGRGDFESCSKYIKSTKVGSIESYTCDGNRINLTDDKRMVDGTLSPPAFPRYIQTVTEVAPGGGNPSYTVAPVGIQSVGKVRWQTLEYKTN